MARLLVKAVDYTHTDPEIDKRGAYKRGDVVVVMPDGHVWGNAEDLPKFERVDLPGASVAEVQYLINAEVQTLEEITSIALRKNKRLLRLVSKIKERDVKTRRRYQINLASKAITDKTR